MSPFPLHHPPRTRYFSHNLLKTHQASVLSQTAPTPNHQGWGKALQHTAQVGGGRFCSSPPSTHPWLP